MFAEGETYWLAQTLSVIKTMKEVLIVRTQTGPKAIIISQIFKQFI